MKIANWPLWLFINLFFLNTIFIIIYSLGYFSLWESFLCFCLLWLRSIHCWLWGWGWWRWGWEDQACWHSHRWWQKCQCKCDCSLCAIFPKRVITTGCLTRWKLPQAQGTDTTLNCSTPPYTHKHTHWLPRIPFRSAGKKNEVERETAHKLKWKVHEVTLSSWAPFLCYYWFFSTPAFVLPFPFFNLKTEDQIQFIWQHLWEQYKYKTS